MVPSPSTQQRTEIPARPNRDGLGYAVAALVMDLLAAAIIIISIWYLSGIDYRSKPPQLDPPRPNPLQGLLFFSCYWHRSFWQDGDAYGDCGHVLRR